MILLAIVPLEAQPNAPSELAVDAVADSLKRFAPRQAGIYFPTITLAFGQMNWVCFAPARLKQWI